MIPQLSRHHRDLMHLGLCPFCEQPIRHWTPLNDNPPPPGGRLSANSILEAQPYSGVLAGAQCRECHALIHGLKLDLTGKDVRVLPLSYGHHAPTCRWSTISFKTGHLFNCPHPEITLD